jgi:hypothetical protein
LSVVDEGIAGLEHEKLAAIAIAAMIAEIG